MRDDTRFSICENVSWREEKLSGKKYIIVGMPQTHSIFFLNSLERKLWILCSRNKTYKEICETISKMAGRDMKKECEKFIKELIKRKIIQVQRR